MRTRSTIVAEIRMQAHRLREQAQLWARELDQGNAGGKTDMEFRALGWEHPGQLLAAADTKTREADALAQTGNPDKIADALGRPGEVEPGYDRSDWHA